MRTCGGCGSAGVDNFEHNVLDVYRGWHLDCIKDALNAERNPGIIVVENISGDFNLSSVIRSANQFSMNEVWIVGKKRFDRRGAVGTTHYETIRFFETIGDAYMMLWTCGYHVLAVDNVEGAQAIQDKTKYLSHTAFVFGEEQRGLSQEAIDNADNSVYIKTRGSARSLNVASAASIIMYDYTLKCVT